MVRGASSLSLCCCFLLPGASSLTNHMLVFCLVACLAFVLLTDASLRLLYSDVLRSGASSLTKKFGVACWCVR